MVKMQKISFGVLRNKLKKKAIFAEDIANHLDDVEEALIKKYESTNVDDLPNGATAKIDFLRYEKWVKSDDVEVLLVETEKTLQDHLEAMPEPLDKKYEYRDVNGLKQIRLYELLPNLRMWKKKLKELLGDEK